MALISSAVTRYGAPYLGWISKRLSRTTVLLFMIGLLWLLAGAGILRMRDQIEAGVLHDNRNIAIACEHQLIQSLEFIDAALLQNSTILYHEPGNFQHIAMAARNKLYNDHQLPACDYRQDR